MEHRDEGTPTRREFMRVGLAAALALPAAPALLGGALSGCGSSEQAPKPAAPAAEPPTPAAQPKPAAPAPAAPAAPAGGGDDLVTEIPAMAPLVETLKYVHLSEKPDQSCSNCQFFTPKSDTRGRCQLFQQGLVESTGWCQSWAKKATTG
jgi:hypothetical protein